MFRVLIVVMSGELYIILMSIRLVLPGNICLSPHLLKLCMVLAGNTLTTQLHHDIYWVHSETYKITQKIKIKKKKLNI